MPVLVLLAVLATAVALGVRRGRAHGDVPARIAAAALGGAAVWTVSALVMPVSATGVAGLGWPVGLAVVLAASIGGTAASGRSRDGARAGLLAAVLSAPAHVAADLTGILQAGHFTLTNAYDVAAYPHSGYPDVASYLLSDTMAGEIITGLVAFPLVLAAIAVLAASWGVSGRPPLAHR
jgi:hypothetical protein